MKILHILTRFYNGYSQIHSINSHKSGDTVLIDLHLSFEKSTKYEEIISLKKQMQGEFAEQIGHCVVNIIVEDD